MESNDLNKLIGKLFSGEYKEQSTGQFRKFGGVLKRIDGHLATFEGRYKTFVLDFRSITSYTHKDPDNNINIIKEGSPQ